MPRGEGNLRLRVPTARHADGSPIVGRVRSDWVPDDSTDVLPLGHRNHYAYRAADFDHPDNVLTVRPDRGAERRTIPRDQWSFARRDATGTLVSIDRLDFPDIPKVETPDVIWDWVVEE